MKSSYAVILVIVCIVVTIAGWNGLMNIYSDKTAMDNSENQQSFKEASRESMEFANQWYKGESTKKANPWILPGTIFFVGIVGLCYGVYSLVKKCDRHKPITTKRVT